MRVPFDPKWRAQARWKKAFYARYMKWLEVLGFVVVACVIGGFIFAFNFRVDDLVKADAVELRFAGTDVAADLDAWVGRPLVENYQAVTAGQDVLELSPDVPPGSPSLPTVVVKASAAGSFVLVAEGRVAQGDVLYRLVDPMKVSFPATVAGDSIAKTDVGQKVNLKDLAIGGGAATLRVSAGGNLLVTRSVGGDLNLEGLSDYAVKLPDDRALGVKGIKSAELDASGDWKETDGEGIPTNPAANSMLAGTVASATHKATVQVGNLPAELRDAIVKQLEADLAKEPLSANSDKAGFVQGLRDFRAVLKLNAAGEPVAGAQVIPATKVDRACDVEIVLNDPPPTLLRALKAGFKVTAKVEVVTGNRPIAFILLKKS